MTWSESTSAVSSEFEGELQQLPFLSEDLYIVKSENTIQLEAYDAPSPPGRLQRGASDVTSGMADLRVPNSPEATSPLYARAVKVEEDNKKGKLSSVYGQFKTLSSALFEPSKSSKRVDSDSVDLPIHQQHQQQDLRDDDNSSIELVSYTNAQNGGTSGAAAHSDPSFNTKRSGKEIEESVRSESPSWQLVVEPENKDELVKGRSVSPPLPVGEKDDKALKSTEHVAGNYDDQHANGDGVDAEVKEKLAKKSDVYISKLAECAVCIRGLKERLATHKNNEVEWERLYAEAEAQISSKAKLEWMKQAMSYMLHRDETPRNVDTLNPNTTTPSSSPYQLSNNILHHSSNGGTTDLNTPNLPPEGSMEEPDYWAPLMTDKHCREHFLSQMEEKR